jgi:glutamate carboxypeptidase
MLDYLRRAVEIESPSNSPQAVNRMASFFARELTKLGGSTRTWSRAGAGMAVVSGFWRKQDGTKPTLILGHTDTVWELGALERMPFKLHHGRAYGPGILDMKSGIVCGLQAVRALKVIGTRPRRPVRFLLNSDEETGSRAYRDLIRAEAERAFACLVLEPGARGGALKTARKGVGEFKITVHGRPAHAGINPAAGVNAIVELARQIVRIEKLSGHPEGVTLNVGLIQGGTRSNVVAEEASASIDVRIPRLADQAVIQAKLRSLKATQPGAQLEITGGINRPPMERRAAKDLFYRARELGLGIGIELAEAETGGGSDGSFAAALGIPTLDGLGGVGDGAHARNEHVIVSELPRRAALLALLLAAL